MAGGYRAAPTRTAVRPCRLHRALAIACLAATLAGCGGNVITRLSTTWVDIRPNPTALDTATRDCRQDAGRPDATEDTFVYCMHRHGWVAMSDPLLD